MLVGAGIHPTSVEESICEVGSPNSTASSLHSSRALSATSPVKQVSSFLSGCNLAANNAP